MTSLGAFRVWHELRASRRPVSRVIGQLLPIISIAVGCVFALAVAHKNARLADAAPVIPEQATEAFLKSVLAKYPALPRIRVIHDGHDVVPAIHHGQMDGTEPYNGSEEFYLRAYQGARSDASVVNSNYEPRPGETLIWCKSSSKLASAPSGEMIMRSDGCAVVRLPEE